MRLIDAEVFCAFLREVSTRQHYETLLINKDKYPTVADVIEAICCDLDGTSLNGFDNAPTVPLPDFKEGYKQAILDGKTNFSRPQGEWIIVDDVYCECPFCKNREVKFSKHCPECGARLKGGAE